MLASRSFSVAGPSARMTPVRPVAGRRAVAARAFKVTVQNLDGTSSVLDVNDGETILEAAMDAGVDLPHDCKMGVCMTCPARVVSGEVDQSAGMLDDEVQEKGYALTCVSTPLSDCTIKVIEEEELLDEVLQASKAATSS